MPRYEALLGITFDAENLEAAKRKYEALTEVLQGARMTLSTYPEGLSEMQLYPEDLRSGVIWEWLDK